MEIILHRGYKGKYPENSLAAFEHALKENLSFEIDIRLSKDNAPFIIHDETLGRLFDGNGRIREKDSKELSKYHYKEDASQKLVSLEELCVLIRKFDKFSKEIFVHIKNIEDTKSAVKVFEKYNIKENLRFFSCDEITVRLIELMKEKYPGYKTGLHFYEKNNFSEKELKKADFLWADEMTCKNITSELVKKAHKLNRPIYAISPELIPESIFNESTEKRWKELIQAGVDGICTDKSDKLKNLFNEQL